MMTDATAYIPTAEDFEFLEGRDITTDKNFASMSYWKGVAIHFLRNRRAMRASSSWAPSTCWPSSVPS